jgi:hypothetical protein
MAVDGSVQMANDELGVVTDVMPTAFRDVWEPRGWRLVEDAKEIADLQRKQAESVAQAEIDTVKAQRDLLPGEEDQIRQSTGALIATSGDQPVEATAAATAQATPVKGAPAGNPAPANPPATPTQGGSTPSGS